MSRNDPVEVTVTFLHATASAVLVEHCELEIWLPRSALTYDGDFDLLDRGELVDIEVQEWLAFERGLI